MSLSLLVYILLLKETLSNFDCITIKSGRSSTGDDHQAIQECTNSQFPTLVSCGFGPYSSGDDDIDGGYMSADGKQCVAINGNGGNGVYAYAR